MLSSRLIYMQTPRSWNTLIAWSSIAYYFPVIPIPHPLHESHNRFTAVEKRLRCPIGRYRQIYQRDSTSFGQNNFPRPYFEPKQCFQQVWSYWGFLQRVISNRMPNSLQSFDHIYWAELTLIWSYRGMKNQSMDDTGRVIYTWYCGIVAQQGGHSFNIGTETV